MGSVMAENCNQEVRIQAWGQFAVGAQRRSEGLYPVETRRFPLLEGLKHILRSFFGIDPAGATCEVEEFLRKLKGSMLESG